MGSGGGHPQQQQQQLPPSAEEGEEDDCGGRRGTTKAQLESVYHLPIEEAAEQLGIGTTVLKKVRECGGPQGQSLVGREVAVVQALTIP